jgi:hypothetical protein
MPTDEATTIFKRDVLGRVNIAEFVVWVFQADDVLSAAESMAGGSRLSANPLGA